MITEEKKYRVGLLVVFQEEETFSRDTYQITRILKGPLIQINDTLQSRYTPQEFEKRQPVIVGEVQRHLWFFKRLVYY